MALIATIQDDLKAALRAHDEVVLSTLRMLSAALTNQRIALQHELTDDEVITVIKKQVQQRIESASSYREGGSEERALAEEAEKVVLEQYLPKAASREELTAFITEASTTLAKPITGAEKGALIKKTMTHFGASADGRLVNEIVSNLS